MAIKKVLITDKVHPLLLSEFQSHGWEVDYDTSVDRNIYESKDDKKQ